MHRQDIISAYRDWIDARSLASRVRDALECTSSDVQRVDARDGTEDLVKLKARVKTVEAVEAEAKTAFLAALDGRAVPADVTGRDLTVRVMRNNLARGWRDIDVAAEDLAVAVAEVFRAEGWKVDVGPSVVASSWRKLVFGAFTSPTVKMVCTRCLKARGGEEMSCSHGVLLGGGYVKGVCSDCGREVEATKNDHLHCPVEASPDDEGAAHA